MYLQILHIFLQQTLILTENYCKENIQVENSFLVNNFDKFVDTCIILKKFYMRNNNFLDFG